jgi:hypothetical protein
MSTGNYTVTPEVVKCNGLPQHDSIISLKLIGQLVQAVELRALLSPLAPYLTVQT